MRSLFSITTGKFTPQCWKQGSKQLLNREFKKEQRSFCPGCGTVDQILTLTTLLRGSSGFHSPVYECFVNPKRLVVPVELKQNLCVCIFVTKSVAGTNGWTTPGLFLCLWCLSQGAVVFGFGTSGSHSALCCSFGIFCSIQCLNFFCNNPLISECY